MSLTCFIISYHSFCGELPRNNSCTITDKQNLTYIIENAMLKVSSQMWQMKSVQFSYLNRSFILSNINQNQEHLPGSRG